MSDKHHSPWSLTPIIDNKVLDITSYRFLPRDEFETEYTIESKYDNRPDLLSYYLYGTAKYWWVFAKRNQDIIFDPIFDFSAGTKIRIPSIENIRKMK